MDLSVHQRPIPAAGPEEDFAPRVERQLLLLVLENGGIATVVAYVLAVAVAILLRNELAPAFFFGWLLVSTLLCAGRLFTLRCFVRRREASRPEDCGCVTTYKALVVGSGLVWGVGGWFLFPARSDPHQLALLVIMAGMVAGAVSLLSPLLWLYVTFVLCVVLPMAARLFVHGGELHNVLGVLFLFFLLVVIKAAQNMRGALVTALDNRLRNEAMVENLEAARAAAEAASRAKDEFLTNMSHEIRTPMNGVLGTLQLLREGRLEKEERELVETAHESAEALLHILNDILDFSRIEAGEFRLERRPFSLSELVTELDQGLAARLAERAIAFEAEIDPRLAGRLVGDPARLRQILDHLLANAVKFTEAGRITVRATLVNQEEDAVVVRLEVLDTGIGIAEADQERLFQSFSQADGSLTRKYGGTGLGLAIVRQLARLMDGCCGVESAPGQGSRFWCEIPFEVAPEEEAPFPSPSCPAAG